MKTRRLAHITILALVGTVASSDALAADLRVPADFPTIQAAIDAAQNGDTVLVAPGTYAPIHFRGKTITVRSEGGPVVTTISAGGTRQYAVRFQMNETRDAKLVGFTITGAAAPGTGTSGGGVLISNASPHISDSVIAGNTAHRGAGVRASGGAPLLTNVIIRGNTATDAGGAIHASGSTITLVSSTAEQNVGAINAGGILLQGGTLNATNVVFRGNYSDQFAGALFANSAALNLSRVAFDRNGREFVWPDSIGPGAVELEPVAGGAIYTFGTVTGTIRDAWFTGNVAGLGGGIYFAGDSSSLQTANLVISENQASLGGGIYVNGAAPVISNATILNNQSIGVYYTNASTITLANSILAGNSQENNPGVDFIGADGGGTIRDSLVGEPLAGRSIVIGQNVRFASPLLGPDLAPLAGSPAIDAGNNALVPTGILSDLAGKPRFIDDPATNDTGVGPAPVVDLGAFEFHPARVRMNAVRATGARLASPAAQPGTAPARR